MFAFAFLGAHNAIERRFNAWGIVVCAFLPALGGGTIRTFLLHTSPAYLSNNLYVLLVLAGAALAVLLRPYLRLLQGYLLVLDAIGMAAFACSGAHAAVAAHVDLPGVIGCAALTASGGGVLSDLVAGKKPHLFTREIWYGLPPVLMGAAYWALGASAQHVAVQDGLLVLTCCMQLALAPTLRNAVWAQMADMRSAFGAFWQWPSLGLAAVPDEEE